MERSRALQRPDQGPWTLRGQGLQLWPKVVDGPGFEDEENIEVVPAERLRGAVGLLRELRDLIVTVNPQAGFDDDRTWDLLRRVDEHLEGR